MKKWSQLRPFRCRTKEKLFSHENSHRHNNIKNLRSFYRILIMCRSLIRLMAMHRGFWRPVRRQVSWLMDLRPFTVARQHRTCTCFPFHLSLYAARETPADAIHFFILYTTTDPAKKHLGSHGIFPEVLRCFYVDFSAASLYQRSSRRSTSMILSNLPVIIP